MRYAFAGEEQPIPQGRPFTGPDGSNFAANWLDLSTPDDRAAHGIVELPEPEPAPADVEALRAVTVAAVKSEAQRRILAVHPVWQQLNMIREGASFAWIDSVRAASDAIEALVPADAEGIAAFDVGNHPAWPA